MSEPSSICHPLAGFLKSLPPESAESDGVVVEIRAGLHHFNLRGDADDERFLRATRDVLGSPLPTIANTMTTGALSTYWLGPDEWLIVSSSGSGPELLSGLERSLADRIASVNELSGGQLALRLAGTDVPQIFAKGCTLDFDARAFPAGSCAQTGLGKANVLIGRSSDDPVFDIIVRRSFAEYLAIWLQNAGAEFAIRFSEGA